MSVVPVPTPSAPAAAGPYSPAVRAGDWLVLAGQVGLDPATAKMVEGGVEAQARQVLANVTAILGDCGASLDRRCQDDGVRHRHRRLRDGQRRLRGRVRRAQAGPIDRAGRRAPRRRPSRDRSLGLQTRLKKPPSPTTPSDCAFERGIRAQTAPSDWWVGDAFRAVSMAVRRAIAGDLAHPPRSGACDRVAHHPI